MGESVPAANYTELKEIVAEYVVFEKLKTLSVKQVDPDATIFSLLIDDAPYYLLEEDYVSDLAGALSRFQDFQKDKKNDINLCKVRAVAGEDDNSIYSYQVLYRPAKLSYQVMYFLAKPDIA